ncbi:MAG: glycosyltransferase family 4 protein [Bacteroidales bacterium]|nr:glycosyltransferase family 4 protein [Bacteroidales bacterium]
MNVLIVHSGNAVSDSQEYTFVREQGDALTDLGVHVSYFSVVGKGAKGYLSALPKLKQAIKDNRIDLIHAHYGLCGTLCVLQRTVPVIITFHNGETLTTKGRILSSIAARFSAHNIFVAQHIHDKLLSIPDGYSILPCGIDLKKLPLCEKTDSARELGLPQDRPNILFGGSFSNERKNYPLAKEAVSLLPFPVNLIELKGYSRSQVNKLLCGCDLFLLPTKSEGSPQVVKEAMACNCPIVATGVADIPELLSGVSQSYVTGFDAVEIARCIEKIIQAGERSDGRQKIDTMKLDNPEVAKQLIAIYQDVLNKKK